MKNKLLFSVFVYFIILTLLSLGFWQIYRLNWKLELIEQIENSLKNDPVELSNVEKKKYIKIKKNRNIEIFFLMGADNLINFHKWHKSELISQKCNIIVFDRHGYKKNSLKSKTFKRLNGKTLAFVEFKKVNISSSQLRKI